MGKHDQESAAVGARRATGAATGRGRGGRFSAGRKRETVLRLKNPGAIHTGRPLALVLP